MRTLGSSRQILISAGLAALLAVLPATPALAQGQQQNARPTTGITVPITGTATPAVGEIQALTGTFTLQQFAVQDGELVAIGNLVATVTDAVTGAVSTILAPITMPVNTSETTASCEVLHLELGPLDLNLLGLVIHLDQVVLDITAVPGSGNLLGNLLCAVAGLLDGTPTLAPVANLLNGLLAALGGR